MMMMIMRVMIHDDDDKSDDEADMTHMNIFSSDYFFSIMGISGQL